MEVRAEANFIRIATRKVGLIARELRGKKVQDALTYLRLLPRKRTAEVLSTLLKSAAANATQKGTIDIDNLYIKTLLIGNGPTLKRFTPRAKGSASPIKKRTTHVKVTLAEQ